MKILIVIDSLAGRGAEKLIYDLAPRMKKRGHDINILIMTSKNGKYIEDLMGQGIPVESMDFVQGHLKKIIFIFKKIRDNQYDLIHANLFPVFYYISIASLFLGRNKPAIVMTEHNTDNRRRHKKYLRPLERFVYRQFKKIISISAMTEKYLKEWLHFSSKEDYRFKVIENGISVDEFANAKPYKKEKLISSFSSGDILLGMFGSFAVQKNHVAMLKIMEYLPEKYKLICAGEGKLLPDIKEKVKKDGLANRVFFLGFRKDVAEVMHTVDVIVVPSLWEGFGLVAAESMACGKPVVASNVPGLAEVVGQYGLLGDMNNPKEIAQLIQMLEDKDTYKNYSTRSSRRAKDFDIEKTVQEYLKVFEESCVGQL